MSEYAPLFVKVDWGGKGEAKIATTAANSDIILETVQNRENPKPKAKEKETTESAISVAKVAI